MQYVKHYQNRTRYLRPIVDEIKESAHPPTIVLRHTDDHLLSASVKAPLNRREIRLVSRSILEALKVLHSDRYVHTGKYRDCDGTADLRLLYYKT